MWTLSSGTILGNRQLFFTNRQYQPFSPYKFFFFFFFFF
jgi:hypothetical protein